MVGTLIRIKVHGLRRAASGSGGHWVFGGAVIGTLLAVGTIGVALQDGQRTGTTRDLLAAVFGLWALGWGLAPAYGGRSVLRAEHFALLPLSRRRLAVGLLAAGFVGVGPAVTLLAFTALVTYATGLGSVVPVAVAVPAVLLQLAFVVLLGGLTARSFAALSRSRMGSAVGAVLHAVMLMAGSFGWLVFVALDGLQDSGLSPEITRLLHVLPSSWPVVAVEASSRSDWPMTCLPLLALSLLLVLLWQAWTRSAGPPRLQRPAVRGSAVGTPKERWASVPSRQVGCGRRKTPSALTAVFVKELRTWLRDPQRIQNLVVPPVFALLMGLLPSAFGSTTSLPFLGAVTAVMAAVTSANLYGRDGTALWLTLLLPGSERVDVRGRQLAWLALFGPASLMLTVVGMQFGGHPDLWPWALAATFALLGGGAGLLPLIGVTQLVPGPDPREAKNSPQQQSGLVGQAFVMLLLVLVSAAPAMAAVTAGHLLGDPAWCWAGLPLSVVTGGLSWLLLGRRAEKALVTLGPQLLYLMQTGKEQSAEQGEGASVFAALPPSRRRLLWTSFGVGCIALFPQSLVPLVMKTTGNVAAVWFVALHMPSRWQWPVIAFMFLLGTGSLTLATRIWYGQQRRSRP